MKPARRFFQFIIILCAAFGIISWRLFHIAYLNHDYYKAIKKNQITFHKDTLGRGDIFLKDELNKRLVLAATSQRDFRIELNKKGAFEIDRTLNLLAGIISFDADSVVSDFLSGKEKILIATSVNQDQFKKIQDLGLKDVNIIAQPKRYYPQGPIAAQILGFLGYQGNDRVGQYGIEAQYEDLLSRKGDAKKETFLSSAVSVFENDSKKGGDIILTVDKNVQVFVEHSISELKSKWEASGASVIIQDSQSGAIIAMAATPSFDPNVYYHYPAGNFLNPNIQEMFEPGSSFKPVTMAAGLDLGKISPKTTYADPGVVRIGSYTIKNFNEKNFGIQTMTNVLEKSLNTGAIFVERLVGDQDFLRYVEKFGFGRETGIDLFGEVPGDIKNLYSRRPINFATASFGQGVAISPLQLITAYSAIANGGKLMKPYIVEKIIYNDGSEKNTEPEIVGRPIKETTAIQLQQMLVSAVDNGFDKARIIGYDVAAKTGTAQIPDGKGGYSDEFIHDFVGFIPAYDSRFTVFLKLDRPKGIQFSSNSLPQPFAEMGRFLINYFQIPPTR